MRRVFSRVARRAYCTDSFKQHQAGNYQVPGGTLENPLAPEVLQQHIDSERKWMEFSNKLDEARETGESELIIKTLNSGIELADELGEELRRPGYEASIHLEASQLHLANNELKESAERSFLAEGAFNLDKDKAGLMRAKLFTANVEIKGNNASKVMESLKSILTWCEVDSKTGTPIEQDAADKLMPLTKLALAGAQVQMGEFDSARAVLSEIIPDFATSKYVLFYTFSILTCPTLQKKNTHTKHNRDIENTWACLVVAEQCFLGMGDTRALKNAFDRQRNWAKRHDLEDRLAEVEKKIEALGQKEVAE